MRMALRHLGVTPSSFYDWCSRPPSRREVEDRALTKLIKEIYEGSVAPTEHRGSGPSSALDHGIRISRKRVARLMRTAGSRAFTCAVGGVGGVGQNSVRPGPRGRRLFAEAPDRIWVADITYPRVRGGCIWPR